MTAFGPLAHTFADEVADSYVPWRPTPVPAPRLVALNRDLAVRLGLDPDALAGDEALGVLAGNAVPDGSVPIAQAYAGHQFGSFNPQLGDGRAVLLGEIVAPDGRRFDVALKGSGPTPFSRGGDGRAALGPVLREYLIGEAMHAIGIPTTRGLAAVATGVTVARDSLLPGAVLTRIAASHLRVGTFQFFAARGRRDVLEALVAHAIRRHDPGLPGESVPALALLRRVAERQAELVARWMHAGFIHGVMNTDNTSISGETIDYGPCAFLDAYDLDTVFSSIDTGGRYAYGNQPAIAQWNVARLAEALLDLLDPDPEAAIAAANEVVGGFADTYRAHWSAIGCRKLGLDEARPGDGELLDDWLAALSSARADHTLAWRRLADAAGGDPEPLRALFPIAAVIDPWLRRWAARAGEPTAERAAAMRAVNPLYIPRNHRVEQALAAAVDGSMQPFDELLAVVREPYVERDEWAGYADPPEPSFTAAYRTFCGT